MSMNEQELQSRPAMVTLGRAKRRENLWRGSGKRRKETWSVLFLGRERLPQNGRGV